MSPAMHEPDDRLVGDPVWELFPPSEAALPVSPAQRIQTGLAVAGILALIGWFSPTLAVVIACVIAAARDARNARRLARAIPDPVAGRVVSRFTLAWAAWKVGAVAFALMFVTLALQPPVPPQREPSPAFITAALLWMGGFGAASVLTAAGLITALRSGMRVWIGEGVNQARTLLLAMLILGFLVFVVMPICFWMVGQVPATPSTTQGSLVVIVVFTIQIVGPVILLLLLDWCCRHVVADRPAKFGPKVSAVGKWESTSRDRSA